MASTKISDQAGSSNIWLGSKQNSRQTILYIPASIAVGGGTADKPGLLFLESISATGTNAELGGLYLWADSADAFHVSATYPTNEDDAASVYAAGATAALLADAAADNVLIRGDGGVRGVQATTITIADATMNTSGMGTLGCGTITIANAGSLNLEEDITFTGATGVNLINFPDNLATALDFQEDTGNVSYLKFVTTDAGEKVVFGKLIEAPTASKIGNLTLANGSITDSSNAIDFGNEALSTTGTLGCGAITSGAIGATGAITATTSIAATTTVTAGTDVIITAGYLSLADDQQIRLGAVGATDSYIEYDTATDDLIFYDRNQTGSISLSQLYAGTPLSPIVTGDLTISDGQFDWTNTAGTADVSLWTFANSTTDPIHIVADSITSGSIIKIESSISAQAGYYLECYDGTNQDFLVGDAGAVTIFGVAGSTVHTITSGDAVIADGSLAITDNDDAAALTIINNTITTGDLISVTADAMTSGSMLYLDNAVGATFSGMYIQCFDGAANDFDVKLHGVTTIAGVASGTDALTLTAGDIKLTAGLVELTLGDVLLTDGMVTADTIQNLQSYIKRNSASAAAPAFVVENTHTTGTGYAMLITQSASSGASGGLSITNAGTSPILSLAAGGARTGYVLDIPMANQLGERGVYVNGAYTGADNEGAIEVASTGALIAGGNLLRLSSTGNNAAASYIAEIAMTAGTLAGATDGFCLTIDDDSTVVGTSYAVNIASASNEALKVTTGKVDFAETMRAVGVQSSASAHTTHATAGSGTSTILAGESFIDVTSGAAAEIIVLPVPVLGDVIVLKANAATAFELRTEANTQFINGTVTTADEELLCAAADTIIATCVVGGASGKWIVVKYDAAGTPAAGGTPD